MLFAILVVIILVVCFTPSYWAQYVLKKHSRNREDYPGTGGEFARHILDLADLKNVPVETTKEGDHYDPSSKTVRLSEENYKGRSLTAVVVAAHEVGHALQDKEGYRPLKIRTGFASVAFIADMAARVVLFMAPVSGYLNPRLALLSIAAVVAILFFRVFLHVITLPVEFDASFKRALPILDNGNYLPKQDMPAARSILMACAMTYVAAMLFSVVDMLRWFRFGR